MYSDHLRLQVNLYRIGSSTGLHPQLQLLSTSPSSLSLLTLDFCTCSSSRCSPLRWITASVEVYGGPTS
jgi:hypothetical protein